MIPVGPLFRQYIRTVRDVSRAHGKLARLVIEGEDVEVDTTIVEALKDSLAHMVRNALDHGIESPETRRQAGKDPMGTVTLRACHEGGHIVIDVEDDGAGLDRRRIRDTARSKGLVADPRTLVGWHSFWMCRVSCAMRRARHRRWRRSPATRRGHVAKRGTSTDGGD